MKSSAPARYEESSSLGMNVKTDAESDELPDLPRHTLDELDELG